MRGESPLASHLLYTQRGVLNDQDPNERMLGIDAGLAWAGKADAVAVYIDRGISDGMKLGIRHHQTFDAKIEYRSLNRETGAFDERPKEGYLPY